MTPEEQYGVIKAPDSPLMAKAAEMFRGIERRVEGSPAEFLLPGGGIATVLEKKAYGQEPTALDYGFAALDTADVLPMGKMAIFAGAASASGVKKIRELLEREQAGQTPEQIFAETDTFRSPIHGRPQFEIDDTGAKLREDSDIFNANRPVIKERLGQYSVEGGTASNVAREDVKAIGRVINKGEKYNVTEYYSQLYPSTGGVHPSFLRDNVSFESKGMQYLEEILDHPELYREYPTAKRIKVEEVPLNFRNRSQVNGLFDPVTETIYINSNKLGGKPEKILPKLFHELQHWVQTQEGFPAGDSPRDIPKDLVQKMQALRKEFVSLEDQTASFLKPIVESAFRSAGELTEAQKGLSGLKASSEAIQQQSKRLAQKLRFFYADYTDALAEGRQSGTFADFIRENAKPGDFGVLDELKGGAGPIDSISDFSKVVTKSGRESTLDALGPIFRRMDNLGEEGFELSYQARLQEEKAFQDYSSTAGEYEARIVEESSKEAGRIPPMPAQRLEEERDRMLVRAEEQAIINKENPFTTTTRPENIRFAERFPPTSEIVDDFGKPRIPEALAQNKPPGMSASYDPAYKSKIGRDVAKRELALDLDRTDLQQMEGFGYDYNLSDFDIKDFKGMSPAGKRFIRALAKEDFLGYDKLDDLLVDIFDVGIEDYPDISPGLKQALGRYLNEISGYDLAEKAIDRYAMGGGVGSMAPVARNMFRGYDIRRGVGAFAPYTRSA